MASSYAATHAAPSHDLRVAPEQYIDQARKQVNFPVVFQVVKAIVQANVISDNSRTALKNWIKSNETTTGLMSLTIIHTISINCSVALRNELAGPKWMSRFDKQLSTKGNNAALSFAIAQMLLDWTYLFSQEELGIRSRVILSNAARHRHTLAQLPVTPSREIVVVGDEATLGLPPVGPRRAPDFLKLHLQPNPPSPAPATAVGGSGAMQPVKDSSALMRLLDDGDVSPSTLQAASAAMCNAASELELQAAAAASELLAGSPQTPLTGTQTPLSMQLQAATAAMCNAASELAAGLQAVQESAQACGSSGISSTNQSIMGSSGHRLKMDLENGYRAAQRCSGWRMLLPSLENELAVAQLCTANDAINNTLKGWQDFTRIHLYTALNYTVPAPPSARNTAIPSSTQPHASQAHSGGGAGAPLYSVPQPQVDLDDLFSSLLVEAPPTAAGAPPGTNNPFANMDPFSLMPPRRDPFGNGGDVGLGGGGGVHGGGEEEEGPSLVSSRATTRDFQDPRFEAVNRVAHQVAHVTLEASAPGAPTLNMNSPSPSPSPQPAAALFTSPAHTPQAAALPYSAHPCQEPQPPQSSFPVSEAEAFSHLTASFLSAMAKLQIQTNGSEGGAAVDECAQQMQRDFMGLQQLYLDAIKRLNEQHLQEIFDIKAKSIQRIKEVMIAGQQATPSSAHSGIQASNPFSFCSTPVDPFAASQAQQQKTRLCAQGMAHASSSGAMLSPPGNVLIHSASSTASNLNNAPPSASSSFRSLQSASDYTAGTQLNAGYANHGAAGGTGQPTQHSDLI
eukprot:gene12484-15695_t